MIALWFCQGLINAVAIGFFIRWAFFTKTASVKPMEDRMTAVIHVLEDRLRLIETDAAQYRVKIDTQLTRLSKICDQASSMVNRGLFSDGLETPSAEEHELKAALHSSIEPLHIPTFEQLQKTKARLKTEMHLDLRTLLQDQLS